MTVHFDKARQKWRYDFEYRTDRYQGYCEDSAGNPVTSKRAAKEAEAAVRLELKKNGVKPKAKTCTLAEAAAWHVEHISQHQKQRKKIAQRMGQLLEYFGPGRDMADISDEDIAQYVLDSRTIEIRTWLGGPAKKDQDETTWKGTGKTRCPATINKYLKLLKMLYKVPKVKKHCGPPEIKLLKQPKRIPTPIDLTIAQKILDNSASHVQRIIMIAVYSGMRETEIVTCRARHVNRVQRIIYLEPDTKSEEARAVYLNELAWQVVEACLVDGAALWQKLLADEAAAKFYAKQWGIHSEADIPLILFLPRGEGELPRPIKHFHTAWRAGKRRAGVQSRVRFHDTRASFCSYLGQVSVNPLKIQRLAGHKDVETTMRYILGADDDLASSVEILAQKMPLKIPLNIPHQVPSQEQGQKEKKAING